MEKNKSKVCKLAAQQSAKKREEKQRLRDENETESTGNGNTTPRGAVSTAQA
jgi:hypothetical protein